MADGKATNESKFTKEEHIKFLREEYDRADALYQKLCDECGEISEQLAAKRFQCAEQLKFMNNIGHELLDIVRE